MTIDDVEAMINKWKADLRHLVEADGSLEIPDPQKRTILLNMMPKKISDHIIKKYNEFNDYEEMEQEVEDLLTRFEQNKEKEKKPINVVNNKGNKVSVD